jgi:hypothetical protein
MTPKKSPKIKNLRTDTYPYTNLMIILAVAFICLSPDNYPMKAYQLLAQLKTKGTDLENSIQKS